MKYVDEYRDGELARVVARRIAAEARPDGTIASWSSAAAIPMRFRAMASRICCPPTCA